MSLRDAHCKLKSTNKLQAADKENLRLCHIPGLKVHQFITQSLEILKIVDILGNDNLTDELFSESKATFSP